MTKEQYGDMIYRLKKHADIIRIDHYETGDMIVYLWDREFPISVSSEGIVSYRTENELDIKEWSADKEFFWDLYHIMEEIEDVFVKYYE